MYRQTVVMKYIYIFSFLATQLVFASLGLSLGFGFFSDVFFPADAS